MNGYTVENERYTGLDLLKVIAMFMVITLHILNASGVLLANDAPNYWNSHFLDLMAYSAVDCFAIITGFCSIYIPFKVKRIIKLWLQVTFYTSLISAAYMILTKQIGISLLLNAVCPILTNQYTYFTQYFVCFLFAPYMNKVICSLDRRGAIKLLVLVLVIFSFYATIDNVANTGGYHVLWICLLYIVGGCIRRGQLFQFSKKSVYFIIYGLAVFITFISKYMIETNGEGILAILASNNSSILVSYTSPTICFSAIALVGLFSNIKLNGNVEKLISQKLSKTNFSVFIIHAQYLLWGQVIGMAIAKYSHWFMTTSFIKVILVIVLLDIGIYFSCTIIDLVRIKIFELARVDAFAEWVSKKIMIGSYIK